VLIVDPRPYVRGVIQAEYRSEYIWRTSCAANADEAASAVLQDRPDAALVAAVLPGKSSGLHLARKLTAMDIPVLIMTAHRNSSSDRSTRDVSSYRSHSVSHGCSQRQGFCLAVRNSARPLSLTALIGC
jgi:CheY-like chemotaxis protein